MKILAFLLVIIGIIAAVKFHTKEAVAPVALPETVQESTSTRATTVPTGATQETSATDDSALDVADDSHRVSSGVIIGSGEQTAAPQIREVTVTHTSSGFEPKTITVTPGTKVTWVNQSGSVWVGADAHPTHLEYDGSSKSEHCAAGYTGAVPFDQCGNSATYSFVFTKVGTWDYHNHLRASEVGTVIVR